MAETTISTLPPHARGVGAALADAGLRSSANVTGSRSSPTVNVLPKPTPTQDEEELVTALLDALEGAGYECHRCQPMPWLIRVTGKRKNVRIPS